MAFSVPEPEGQRPAPGAQSSSSMAGARQSLCRRVSRAAGAVGMAPPCFGGHVGADGRTHRRFGKVEEEQARVAAAVREAGVSSSGPRLRCCSSTRVRGRVAGRAQDFAAVPATGTESHVEVVRKHLGATSTAWAAGRPAWADQKRSGGEVAAAGATHRLARAQRRPWQSARGSR